ncbi:MAG: cyd operon YbgE family protein [Burkholderiaceae bacterium]
MSIAPANPPRPANSVLARLARGLSLAVGLAVTASVAVYPRMYATDMQDVPHGLMALLMIGMSACYVHGIGFVPRNPVLRLAFSPLVAWPLVAYAAWAIATR